ncbi:hypothetical protein PAMA_000113 [Pampus argenteus]
MDEYTPKKKMRVVNDTDTKNSCSVVSKDGSVRGTKREFKANYTEIYKLGEGGFGTVFAGLRTTDNVPTLKWYQCSHLTRSNIVIKQNTPLNMFAVKAALLFHSGLIVVSRLFQPDKFMKLIRTTAISCLYFLQMCLNEDPEKRGTLEQLKLHPWLHQLRKVQIEASVQQVINRSVTQFLISLEIYRNNAMARVCIQDLKTFLACRKDHGEFKANYTEIYKLGEGGFGTVFAGLRTTDNVPMCLNVYPEKRGTLEQLKLHPWLHQLRNVQIEASVQQVINRSVTQFLISLEIYRNNAMARVCIQDLKTFLACRKDYGEFKANYTEIYKLGEGGFGTVFAGLRTTDNVPVAIKHIPKENVYYKKVMCLNEDPEKRGTLEQLKLHPWLQ